MLLWLPTREGGHAWSFVRLHLTLPALTECRQIKSLLRATMLQSGRKPLNAETVSSSCQRQLNFQDNGCGGYWNLSFKSTSAFTTFFQTPDDLIGPVSNNTQRSQEVLSFVNASRYAMRTALSPDFHYLTEHAMCLCVCRMFICMLYVYVYALCLCVCRVFICMLYFYMYVLCVYVCRMFICISYVSMYAYV